MASINMIKESLRENLGLDPELVTPESTLESLNIDSLDMTELICDIEEKCDIELGDMDNVETIGQMADYIDSLK